MLETKEKVERVVPIKRNGIGYSAYLLFKRIFDLVSSVLVLILTSPVVLVCLAIKYFEDFHNPIYVSTRVGKDGKTFRFYKIRSMHPNAEQLKEQMIKEGKNEADGPAFKMKNDPRITKFGKFLRKTSIDELLQLVNIIKGDMSVVGPRPPLEKEVEKYDDYQKHRLDVKGGLLCLWQIQPDRHSVEFEQWVDYDIEYINNQSLWLDIKIIFVGAFMIFSGKSGD